MSFFETWLLALAVVIGMMVALWLVSIPLKNASIVDIFWGVGFAVVAVLAAAVSDGWVARRVLIAALVSVWGLRLAAHIFWRNRGKGEDPRYQSFRRNAPFDYRLYSLFQVFLLQGLLLWIISAPLVAAATATTPDRLTVLDVLGIAIWLVGFFFESVGDLQLARFKGDPANKGRVMDRGLWRYTRHPNYFGDATAWWGYFLIAAATPNGWLTAFSPLLMTFLLLRVSGVALLERSQTKTKPGYRDYVERTSAFVPWFPRGTKDAGG